MKVLLWVGRLSGVTGALMCLVAFVVRLTGQYFLGGYQLGTLLLGGIAAMVLGCFCLLVTLTSGARTLR